MRLRCSKGFCQTNSGKRNAEMAAEEIAERAAHYRRGTRPRTAFQNFMIAVKPDFRIFGIRKTFEIRIAAKIARRPFPHIAAQIKNV